jgi:hypothetical protein
VGRGERLVFNPIFKFLLSILLAIAIFCSVLLFLLTLVCLFYFYMPVILFVLEGRSFLIAHCKAMREARDVDMDAEALRIKRANGDFSRHDPKNHDWSGSTRQPGFGRRNNTRPPLAKMAILNIAILY